MVEHRSDVAQGLFHVADGGVIVVAEGQDGLRLAGAETQDESAAADVVQCQGGPRQIAAAPSGRIGDTYAQWKIRRRAQSRRDTKGVEQGVGIGECFGRPEQRPDRRMGQAHHVVEHPDVVDAHLCRRAQGGAVDVHRLHRGQQ